MGNKKQKKGSHCHQAAFAAVSGDQKEKWLHGNDDHVTFDDCSKRKEPTRNAVLFMMAIIRIIAVLLHQ
jgi:hypothetical protein